MSERIYKRTKEARIKMSISAKIRFWESQIKKYPNECLYVLKPVFTRTTRQIVSNINELPKK